MFRNKLIALALVTMGFGACASDDKASGSGATSPAPPNEVVYAQGFYDLERDANTTWRWMEPEGVVRLKNTGKDMVLKVSGRAPVERFKQAPQIKFSFNGVQLDQASGTPEILSKEFMITPAQQGKGEWSELRITSDQSFVPKEVDKGGTDPRRLAFSVTQLSWEPK